MQSRKRIALGMGLLMAAGCAGQQVSTDYKPTTNFSQYRTFALVAPPDSSSAQQLLDQRVHDAVLGQLAAKGLTQTDRRNADLFVGYGVVDRTHKEVYTDRQGWGWGRGYGWRYYRWGVPWPMTVQRRIETYTDGSVVVSLIDARTKQAVWRGEVADVVRLPVKDPEDATREIAQAVAKAFEKYPPQSSGSGS